MDILNNKKRQFRDSLLNYTLDKDYYLCFLHFKEDKKFDLKKRRHNNFHIKKNENECEILRIPTVNNIINLIEVIHKATLY